MTTKTNLAVQYVAITALNPAPYNPRKHTKEQMEQLTESIRRFGVVDPIIANRAPGRENVLIGGHMRLEAMKVLKYTEAPVVYVDIADPEKEKELNLRLNKNTGEFDLLLLAEFDETLLEGIGFSSEELDEIFPTEETPEQFNLKKELEKLDITEVKVKEGDVYALGHHRLMCGDSMRPEHMQKLMGGEKADMCFTDPPYILDYLHGKKKHKATEGFGYKRDRRYLGTDTLPDDFTQRWMANVAAVQKEDFSIIVFENWKNVRTIWDEMEKRWKVKNMLIWHLPNRVQGFSAKYKFFNKYDIAVVGQGGSPTVNTEKEAELLQEEYETALFAISGKPQWEGYKKGSQYCPTDFIEFRAEDAKHSGQGIIFGTKPVEILIPYIKILTKRGDLILEPFGGSGSTLIASEKMERRCYVMEKSPVYAEVIKKRWENLTGKKATLWQSEDEKQNS